VASTSTGFVQNIEPRFNGDPDESVLGSLLREYEHVVFKSIITAFGLDLFIKDQYGGDVDTIHNVRAVGTDPNMHYKNAANETAYQNRGEYSHKLVEGQGTNFQRIKHDARIRYGEDPKHNTVQDAYEDKPLGFLGKSKNHPTDKSAELDHVIAVKEIHDDRGRVLAGMSTVELADSEDNLRWTNEHLNKSMGADEIPDYIASHPELPGDVKKRMMDAYTQAKIAYEKKLAKAYYFDFSNPNCRQFYKEAAVAAKSRGIEMGLRQAMGFLMTELWFSVKDAIEESDGTMEGVLKAIPVGLQNAWSYIKENYKELIVQFGEGFLSGVFASVTSTLCNVFFTTTENMGRILRQAWASIVEATSILLFNDKDQYLCDRMTSAAKVLATGASMIIGTTVQTKVEVKLAETTLSKDLRDIISIFSGSLCTGLLTVSFLFYIDNGPFTKFLIEVNGETNRRLEEQNRIFKNYCAQLEKIDVERLTHEAECVYDLSQRLSDETDQMVVNAMLSRAVRNLGLPSAFGNFTIDDRMNDKNWILKF
jgi:hypothetical protein